MRNHYLVPETPRDLLGTTWKNTFKNDVFKDYEIGNDEDLEPYTSSYEIRNSSSGSDDFLKVDIQMLWTSAARIPPRGSLTTTVCESITSKLRRFIPFGFAKLVGGSSKVSYIRTSFIKPHLRWTHPVWNPVSEMNKARGRDYHIERWLNHLCSYISYSPGSLPRLYIRRRYSFKSHLLRPLLPSCLTLPYI